MSDSMPTLSNEDLQMIALLERQTGARANDVVLAEDSVIFVVQAGDLGRAIGKAGANIAKLRHRFGGKQIDVFEYSDDAAQFLKNVFHPVEVRSVEQVEAGGRKVFHVSVDLKNKGLAIGKAGSKIKKARMLAKRYFQADDVKIL